MNVELVNTGSELMLGRVLNTHQQWLCRRLADLGHVVTRQVAVADASNEIQQAVREALSRADLVITTGGLGPTSDDLTRELIAELLGKKLVENQAVRAHIENFFAQRNRPRPAKTSVETFVPDGALFFLNPIGTARQKTGRKPGRAGAHRKLFRATKPSAPGENQRGNICSRRGAIFFESTRNRARPGDENSR